MAGSFVADDATGQEANGQPQPQPPPRRRLHDQVTLDGLDDLVDADCPGRHLVMSREFMSIEGFVRPAEIQVVLYDHSSLDSFAASLAVCLSLKDSSLDVAGHSIEYVGVDRAGSVEELDELGVQYSDQVVAMLGVVWSLEAIHDLVNESQALLIFETHTSVFRELEQLSYPNLVAVMEENMGAAAMAWNFFLPHHRVPALVRAIEDAALGRRVLRDSVTIAQGLDAAIGIIPPKGRARGDCAELEKLAQLLAPDGGRAVIDVARRHGIDLHATVEAFCTSALDAWDLRTMDRFPHLRCAVAEFGHDRKDFDADQLTPRQFENLAGPAASRLAEEFASRAGEAWRPRCFAAVWKTVRDDSSGQSVRVVIHAPAGGPDLSEISCRFEGIGRPSCGSFRVSVSLWRRLWIAPTPIVWDVEAIGPACLELLQGDNVVLTVRGMQRFEHSASDEWSWGYEVHAPLEEGWIPTNAHTLFLVRDTVETCPACGLCVQEGHVMVALEEHGDYFYGYELPQGGIWESEVRRGWFPKGNILSPLPPASATFALRLF